MLEPDEFGVYIRVGASPARRVFAYLVLLSLGALLIYTALARPPALHWLIFLLVFGGALLWLAERLRRASRLQLELTADELRDTSGRTLARLDDIQSVSRGAFALKPSSGFTLVLKSTQPPVWAPGMWWRLGRRVGVGGVTSAQHARLVAEQCQLFLQKQKN